jgi:hypothetical protein
MSYRIRPGKPLTGEVVRVVAGSQYRKAPSACCAISSAARMKPSTTRAMRFKRLRGLFRLVRTAAPEFLRQRKRAGARYRQPGCLWCATQPHWSRRSNIF